jgi:hypothetical protein
MSDNIVQLFPKNRVVQPVAHFFRLGDSGHRQLAAIHAAGGFPASRVVVDASRLEAQKELVDALKAFGAEIVLDTKVAELAAPLKCGGYARGAPWADGELLGPDSFRKGNPSDIFGQIARFSVENDIDVVLAPTHYLGDKNFEHWLNLDVGSCLELRKALDKEGGSEIAIDYGLILPHTWLANTDKRGLLMSRLADLPFDNLWIRASGFYPNAGGLAQKKYIGALSRFHNLGRPVVIDYLDGMVALATVAFGATAGIAHGIGERGRFDASSWHKEPAINDEGSGFGQTKRMSLPFLDKSLTEPELRTLVSSNRARRLINCGDLCCSGGLEDMIKDPKRHSIYQSIKLVGELSKQPDLSRADHFVDNMLAKSVSVANRISNLKPKQNSVGNTNVNIESLMKRLKKHSEDKSKIHQALEFFLEDIGDNYSRSKPLYRSTKQQSNENLNHE